MLVIWKNSLLTNFLKIINILLYNILNYYDVYK